MGGALALQQPGLLALSQPIFGQMKSELASEQPLASLIPISSISFGSQDSGYYEGKHETLGNAVGTSAPAPRLMEGRQQENLRTEPETCMPEGGGQQIEVADNDESKVDSGNETDVVEGGTEAGMKEDGGGTSDGSSRKKGMNSRDSFCRHWSGKWRNVREMSRKKKTKGLGGSISETTRRMLLEYARTDRKAGSVR